MKRLLVTLVAASLALVGVAAASASPPAGGTIRIFVVPGENQGDGTAVLAGAIGDYGKTTRLNKHGLGVMLLHKGTIEFDLATLSKKINSSKPLIFNGKTCSFVVSATAPVTILKGTGLYEGISGTISLTETFAGYGPLYTSGAHKGHCNTSNNATPTAQYGSVQGVGTVKFS